MTIEKLNSGFYMAREGNYIIDSALIAWDGMRGSGGYNYNTGDPNYCRYYIAANNTVYYSMTGGSCGIWCSGEKLRRHCHKLQQIAARA